MRDRYFDRIYFTMDAPDPLCPNPNSLVLPRSLSNAATCLPIYAAWRDKYCAAPSLQLPDSSPLQATNLNVLLGRYPNCFKSLSASKTVTNPPPSSLAPVCEPVSHVSICPPATIIWSGQFAPVISNTTLDELLLGTNWLSRVRLTRITCPRACILENISASSTVMAAQGIFGYNGSYSIQPVCTDEILSEATDRTSIALAPYFPAIEGPSTRQLTEEEQLTHGLLKQTILPGT